MHKYNTILDLLDVCSLFLKIILQLKNYTFYALLMQILEPRFSAEVLAAILSIPLNKTLLRRHLTTHFVALIGNNVQQQKRNIESDPNYVPLTTNQKVKVVLII